MHNYNNSNHMAVSSAISSTSKDFCTIGVSFDFKHGNWKLQHSDALELPFEPSHLIDSTKNMFYQDVVCGSKDFMVYIFTFDDERIFKFICKCNISAEDRLKQVAKFCRYYNNNAKTTTSEVITNKYFLY